MKERITLNCLQIGEKATVKQCDLKEGIARRLLDLGCIENTSIEKVYKSPFNNPCAYSLRGALIAIRNDVAKQIIVEREDSL